MSYESLLGKCSELLISVNTLAAIAAKLRLMHEGASVDSRIQSQLDQIADLVEPGLFHGLDHAQQAVVLAYVNTSLRQALDFLENPARPPGWHHDDPAVLDNQGKASKQIIGRIQTIAAKRASLAEALRQPGHLLDVGTGVGWIAIEAARTWPTLHITGIDIWEPSLALARSNVAASDLEDRVSIRSQDLEELNEADRYNLVWLPSPFIPEDVIRRSLNPILRALTPGGNLIFAHSEVPTEPVPAALASLNIIRMGGHPWRCEEVEEMLTRIGFTDVEATTFSGIKLTLIAARKPGGG